MVDIVCEKKQEGDFSVYSLVCQKLEGLRFFWIDKVGISESTEDKMEEGEKN